MPISGQCCKYPMATPVHGVQYFAMSMASTHETWLNTAIGGRGFGNSPSRVVQNPRRAPQSVAMQDEIRPMQAVLLEVRGLPSSELTQHIASFSRPTHSSSTQMSRMNRTSANGVSSMSLRTSYTVTGSKTNPRVHVQLLGCTVRHYMPYELIL